MASPSFKITSANGHPKIWSLSNDQGDKLEVWPDLGFNAYCWQAGGFDLLYRDAQFFIDKKASRSGFPILFPFPNRIRKGTFSWNGSEYRLPTNDPSGKNAIHGFVHTAPWRVVDQGCSDSQAWITGEIQGSVDVPASLPLWPGDYRLQLTYRLSKNRLRIEAQVRNPGPKPLPFGLGYHPYFRTEPFGGEEAKIQVPARSVWQLEECLPTGQILPVDSRRDLQIPKAFRDLQLDDLLTDFAAPSSADKLLWRGSMAGQCYTLDLFTSPDFTEMVVFTPPHRQAICLEPYTCPTNAIHLGKMFVLEPKKDWQGEVEIRLGNK